MKQKIMAVGLLAAGLVVSAAQSDPGLPDGYWQQPAATDGAPPAHFSALEANLHPEACAQCHQPQFDKWKDSKHAHAYSSGMVGQFSDMGAQNANDCLICHAPLAEQLYPNGKTMRQSLQLRLDHPAGFDPQADVENASMPLRHAGVTCATCHVRGWQRFGPPPKITGSAGHQDAPAHGGFTATRDFEKSTFCASCHQFPQSMAIHGKPLENTLTEWKESSFSKRGVSCQQCHMPDRRHEFRGIHDPAMVRKGLDMILLKKNGGALLRMTSVWIGHAFPTYVTPKVVVRAEALNKAGKVIRSWQWEIIRKVGYDEGWKEVSDTRLMPGESRDFPASPLPAATRDVHYTVTVTPDYFYKGLYRSLLSGSMDALSQAHITRASQQADKNDYLLYDEILHMK
ncbi:MAG: multiheme c-type cytochrome [Mariprofundus sp.]